MAFPQRFRRSYLPFWLEVPCLFLGRLLYHVRSRGVENIPAQGGVLLIANHISYVDAVVLQLACPRPIHFVGYEGFQQAHWFAHWLFRVTQTIPISPRKSLNSTRRVLQALKSGAVVCSFPEGAISRTGQLMALRPGFEMMARRAGVPVVPVAHDGLWGSVFSFVGNKYLWKSPRLMPTPVFVVFGRPVPPDRIDVAGARNAMLDLAAEAFHERPILRRHLARETVRALAKRPRHLEIIDRTTERREITAAQLLATAAALSRHIRRTIPDRRVGIVLPPGIGATLANLAVVCAGKVPANLNFTLGRPALESCLRLGEIRTILTADAVKAKVPAFPWTEDTRDLRAEIVAAGGKRAILPWLLAAWLLPNQWFPALLGLPKVGDNEEAVLLFTSGSSGEPKGVGLTHRNIIANCAQISSLAILPDNATMLACLPVFHSFGCTATVWYPILRGCHVVTVPSPLDTRKIIEAIRDEQTTVMVGAPTFLRPFLKKAEKSELSSLTLIATGAEKLPLDLYDAFLRQFGIEIMQCYGITETSPAANVNQPDPPVVTRTGEPQLGKRLGSVGRLMPGMTARIVDPETGAELPATNTGMILLKGANVFNGYLKDPEKTTAALRDGFFVTGDLGRFDDDGFLYIEGRISRFSKIGGEMVPHGTVEQKILTAFGWETTETPGMAVVGVPDPVKGEQLVLITTHEIATDQLRERLLAAGLPALWIPKIIRRVEAIPLLGSGKLDLKSCKAIALQASE